MATCPWVMLLVTVGLNSSGDTDINCSCWHVRLKVGLSRRGSGWGESGVGGWAGLDDKAFI